MTDTVLVPADALEDGATNVFAMPVDEVDAFDPVSHPGASRYRYTYPDGRHLDALLVAKESDVLVVNFHGALDRGRYTPPRFERLRTSLEMPYSTLYLADPCLWAHETVALAWYIGYHEVCAAWATAAAEAVGAKHVIFAGSSGGGYAALQSATFVPGSIAVPFNPQTSVHGYHTEGGGWSAQRKFIEVFHRELAPDNLWAMDFSTDWTADLGEAYSPIRRYQRPVPNQVIYGTNPLDFHHDEHLPPFLEAVRIGGNTDRVRVHQYDDGQTMHLPPNNRRFHIVIEEAVTLARETVLQ